tara:strand:- start:146 stop:691 length:546 start_codon:yes stop_codon:yes gene_type:complete
MKLISTTTVGSTVSSVNFNSIPSSPHLYLAMDLHIHNGNASGIYLTINNETTGMYDTNGASSSGGGSSSYSYGSGGWHKQANNASIHNTGNSNDRTFIEVWFPFANWTQALTTNSNRTTANIGGGKQMLFRAQSLGYGWYGRSYGWSKCYTASAISSIQITHGSGNKIDTGSKISLWQLEY